MTWKKKILLCGISFVAASYATTWVVAGIESRQERERLIQAEIAKVSRYYNAYSVVWSKLVEKHGSNEAALVALRNWAESMIEYREAEARWKKGIEGRPEGRKPLVHFTTSEAYSLHKMNCKVPYGCSKSVDAMFGNWDAPDDDRSAGMLIGSIYDD